MASLRKEVRDKANSLLAEKFCRSCNKHKTQEKGRLAKLARMK